MQRLFLGRFEEYVGQVGAVAGFGAVAASKGTTEGVLSTIQKVRSSCPLLHR